MMTSTLCTCTWLLLPCCVLVTLSTGELDFYRDEIPESSKQIRLRRMMRNLERVSSLFPSQVQKRQRDFLEAILKQEESKGWNHRQARYNEPINELPQDREYYFPSYGMNSFKGPTGYENVKLPYLPRETYGEDMNLQADGGYGYNRIPLFKHLPYKEPNFDMRMKEEPLLDFHGSYDGLVNENGKGDRQMQRPHAASPEFTYKFDDSNLLDRHPFAVRPNNPRYYQDPPFFSGDKDKLDFDKPMENNSKWEGEETAVEKVHTVLEENPRNIESKFKETSVFVVPELERRTEYNPVFVPVNQDLNNDIYFIAIVAGCSAAAMFALVLIALTWCRLKRGAKAAADIEYPAYGVTGPNKEVSPSGDQRLAQSAQMYHFQHQKQQIIAMEKEYRLDNDLSSRVSATRDPGSVSEAESEEENEEGDYTVYECPGLASTGEMEVKNPLFHDDPTPAQSNKEKDHI